MGSRLPKLLLLIPLAFLVVFFYVPLVSILKTGLWENGFTLGHVTSVLSNDYHRRVILFTIGQAIASTLLTLALGLPGAYIFAKYNFPGKDTVKAILTVPFVVPSVMVALGFILLFGKSGLVTGLLGRDPPGILYSWKGILLAHAFYNFPIVVRMVSALWERINPHYEEAAMALGARGWRLFWRVTLPMISPAIFASAMLTFVFCFLSFSIPLIIGGYRYATMEVDIFTSIMVLLDFRTGAAMAIIQIALSMAFMYLYLKALDAYARREEQRILRKPVRFTRGGDWLSLKGLFVAVYTLIVFVFIVSPLLAVLYDSLRFNDSWSLENYRRLFSSGYNPMFGGATTLDVIRNSLTFGLATVFLSVLVALPVAYALHRWNFRGRRLFDVLVMLPPLASSPVTLGLGYIRVFHTTRLYYTVWIVIAAHTVIAYPPFVLRAVSTSLKKIRPNLWEAALSLGGRGSGGRSSGSSSRWRSAGGSSSGGPSSPSPSA